MYFDRDRKGTKRKLEDLEEGEIIEGEAKEDLYDYDLVERVSLSFFLSIYCFFFFILCLLMIVFSARVIWIPSRMC